MSLEITVKNDSTDESDVTIAGRIDENCEQALSSLFSLKGKKVSLDLQGVESVNSLGFRHWINFMNGITADHKVHILHCSAELICQASVVARFFVGATIESFYGAFTCEHCKHEGNILFETKDGRETIQNRIENARCPACSEEWDLDEDTESFLEFMKRQPSKAS